MLQLVLLHLASYLRLRWFLDRIGHSMGNYASVIRDIMKDIKECIETLFFHIRWILAHGETVLLYAEDLSMYFRRRHRFHPADHRKLDDISEADCYTWFSQNNENMRHLLLHLQLPDTFVHQSNGMIHSGETCFLVYLYHITKGTPFTKMARFVFGVWRRAAAA